MKIGIIGQAQCGKATVFEALTHLFTGGAKGDARVGTVPVPDERLQSLTGMYNPAKTTPAQVEYFLPGAGRKADGEPGLWYQARDCDAVIHVVRNFGGYGFSEPTPLEDFKALDQDIRFSDLVIVENRLERLQADHRRGKKINPEEQTLLEECRTHLEDEQPLRRFPHLANSQLLKGFALLSARPVLVLFNNPDDVDDPPDLPQLMEQEKCLVIRGKLEHELAQMSEEDAREFLDEFDISASATNRVIKASYQLLGLISFFTVGEDEVRAWTVVEGTPAQKAAGVIHTDMEKGFIRAEVIGFDALIEAGSHQEAKKKAALRLEGKTYPVQDGDVMEIRFNV
jgi:GTP-binding protein YchF